MKNSSQGGGGILVHAWNHDLQIANTMLMTTEDSAHFVFSKVGKSEEVQQAYKILEFIQKKGEVDYRELLRFSQSYFPDAKAFAGILQSFVQGGQVQVITTSSGMTVRSIS